MDKKGSLTESAAWKNLQKYYDGNKDSINILK